MKDNSIVIHLNNGGSIRIPLDELKTSAARLEQLGVLEGRREYIPDEMCFKEKEEKKRRKYYKEW